MKLGAFSDLHSNIFALDAMLASAPDVGLWVSLGDAVGLFPPVNEVLDAFRMHGFLAINGNHEACLLSGAALANSVSGSESLALQRAVVSAENSRFVAGLPQELTFDAGGRRVRAMHALPQDAPGHEAKYRVDLRVVNDAFRGMDIVLFGDTHLPALCHCRDLLLVNPGSCGFPIDVTGQPSFAVIDTANLSCELRRFAYDTGPLLETIRQAGYNEALYRYVQTGSWER